MEPMSFEELRKLPPTITVLVAGKAFGFGRTKAYRLAEAGEFPCAVMKVGRSYRVLTAGELADRWGVTPSTIRTMAALDQIPAARLGKNWRYSYQAVTEALKCHHDNLTANDPGDLDDAGTEPYAEPDAQPPTWPAVCPACGQLKPR